MRGRIPIRATNGRIGLLCFEGHLRAPSTECVQVASVSSDPSSSSPLTSSTSHSAPSELEKGVHTPAPYEHDTARKEVVRPLPVEANARVPFAQYVLERARRAAGCCVVFAWLHSS